MHFLILPATPMRSPALKIFSKLFFVSKFFLSPNYFLLKHYSRSNVFIFSTASKMSALSNFDIIKIVQHSNIPEFRGVYMRDQLLATPKIKESGIVNLNTSKQNGSHWVAYYKDGAKCIYFD